MPGTGDVQLTIVDNGGSSVVVAPTSVQVVMGCCSGGTVGVPYATRSPSTLASNSGSGPAVEAAALACLGGATVIFCKLTANAAGAAGTVTFVGTGTSVVTVTGAARDTYYVAFKVIKGGTIASSGITFQLSLDAGRSYGPTLSLGTANTYAIPGTGLTLNFAAGTLVAADLATFGTTEPDWNDAGVQVALNALLASPYALTGWGSAHLVGGGTTGGATGSDASTIQGYLDTLAVNKLFTHLIVGARDASPAAKWSGTGESEATWQAALLTDYSAAADSRIAACAGHYNTPSAYSNAAYGSPRFRRSLAYDLAARVVKFPAQQHAGRVKSGGISTIVVDPSNDPADGFIYHDERINPGLDAARFTTAWTRTKKTGYWFRGDNTMAQVGSDFALRPRRAVMDIGCDLLNQTGQDEIDDDVRLNADGTIDDAEAASIESNIKESFRAAMISTRMVDDVTIAIDRTNNVRTQSAVNITATLFGRGYVLTVNATIAYASAAAA